MKRDTRAAYRRRAADTERMVDAAVAAVKQEQAERFAAAKEAARVAEAARPKFTRADLADAHHVHDGHRWLRVVRVNRETVTVQTPWSWTERVRFDRVHRYADAAGFHPGDTA